jgi:hypothetical protein
MIKQVEVEVYGNNAKDPRKFVGRLLGFVTEREFAALLEFPRLRKKLSTVETTSLSDIGKLNTLDDMRLVFVVKERENNPVIDPVLFITDPLDVASYIMKNSIGVEGRDTYIMIDEKEV